MIDILLSLQMLRGFGFGNEWKKKTDRYSKRMPTYLMIQIRDFMKQDWYEETETRRVYRMWRRNGRCVPYGMKYDNDLFAECIGNDDMRLFRFLSQSFEYWEGFLIFGSESMITGVIHEINFFVEQHCDMSIYVGATRDPRCIAQFNNSYSGAAAMIVACDHGHLDTMKYLKTHDDVTLSPALYYIALISQNPVDAVISIMDWLWEQGVAPDYYGSALPRVHPKIIEWLEKKWSLRMISDYDITIRA